MAERFPCPCCGGATLEEAGGWDICEACGWEDDPSQADHPRMAGGANRTSLEDARAEWRATGAIDFHRPRPWPGLGAYAFRRLTEADLPLVSGWIAAPHVAEWWDGPLDASDLAQADHRLWLVELGGRPFAFVQDYDPHAEPGHPFAHLPPGARGVDLFIGDVDMKGGGHGSALLETFAARLTAEGAPAVGGDPRPDNPAAVRAFEKAGFARGPVVEAPWGPALLMTKYAP